MTSVHPLEPQINSNKYRTYAASVDKALKAFECTTEWADLIAALGKLSKVFQSNSKSFHDIPKTVTVAKRLSQCLHPALPGGVHLKTLETYKQVFTILGQDGNLARNLYLFAIGLFPLMDHCGLKVKSELMSLFEKFLLPLGPNIRSALPGFIAAVLFALEEGTDFYQPSNDLLDQVMETAGSLSFYACLWQAVKGNPSVRLPALIFVNSKIDKKKAIDDQLAIISGGETHADYMTEALCAVAEDPGSPLVQRNLLDFLCNAIPLNSAHVVQADLVQILRRCLFVVLRRDMSLNRRLYQWLLNRSPDNGSLTLGGAEELTDLDFFNKYSIPLIRSAIADFLPLQTVEIPVNTSPLPLADTWSENRNVQVQYTEVRFCRLLHYFLDRPELGTPILKETLLMFLEYSCKHNTKIIQTLLKSCEEVDVSFSLGTLWESWAQDEGKLSDLEKERRLDEINKTFNSLLNSLESSFLWEYLGDLLAKLLEPLSFKTELSAEEEANLTIEERERRNYEDSKRKEHLMLYPLMLAFCVKNVQLDSHTDIRNRHVSKLLKRILELVTAKGCDNFSRDNFVAILCVCRQLLSEIGQNASLLESESKTTVTETNDEEESSSTSTLSKNTKREDQILVEDCLQSCKQLTLQVCNWYVNGRERDKAGVLCATTSFLKDFAEFPFVLYNVNDDNFISSLRSNHNSEGYSDWFKALLQVFEVQPWLISVQKNLSNFVNRPGYIHDFDVRARHLDLVLHIFVRTCSIIEQWYVYHGRFTRNSYFAEKRPSKSTVTFLLKPFISELELNKLEEEGFFKKASFILWHNLEDFSDTVTALTVSRLLIKLHSRKPNDRSSEVEEIIVHDLTAQNKLTSLQAAVKFRLLWGLNREQEDSITMDGLTSKPLNKVIMVFLGLMAYENKHVEVRDVAFSWLSDCATCGDLHKILQMLFMMLLTPASARVSVQFVQIENRLSKTELPTMPEEVNSVSLTTVSGKQTFHHVCRDIDVPMTEKANPSSTTPWNNFSYVDCSKQEQWISDLKNKLLMPTPQDPQSHDLSILSQRPWMSFYPATLANLSEDNFLDASTSARPRTPLCTTFEESFQQPESARKGHKRTVSDIPQFDQDAESVGSLSLDESMDPEVYEAIQQLIDQVCDACDDDINRSDINQRLEDCSDSEEASIDYSNQNGDLSNNDTEKTEESEQEKEDDVAGPLPTGLRSPGVKRIPVYQKKGATRSEGHVERPSTSASTVSAPVLNAISRVPESIKRVKYGHRRQDSLQETIFSTSTQELRLFDPTELPNLTSPGDSKQPLLDESHAHMLIYAESPHVVDLGRAEEIFRIMHALLKSNSSSKLGKMIVACMLFTNTAQLHQNQSTSNGVQKLIDALARHYKHIQGKGFWGNDDSPKSDTDSNAGPPPILPGSEKNRNPTFFEIFSTILLYFLRSYYLNSPTAPVSQQDLELSTNCKIAAMDCFSELLRVVNELIKEFKCREFVNYVQQSYRLTRTQRVVISLMLTMVPAPPNNKDWRMPITVDIAEFNGGPQLDERFRRKAFSFHRSLLDLASTLVVLEFNMFDGVRHFSSQNLGISFERLHENRQLYNSPQNRSTIRDPRYMVVELKMFIGVVLNALRRSNERHELWLRFIVNSLPYLDRTLPTFCVHVVDQLCRNIYSCISNNFAGLPAFSSSSSVNSGFDLISSEPSTPVTVFEDFRFPKTDIFTALNAVNSQDYPLDYCVRILRTLTSILHYGIIDSSPSSSPFLLLGASFGNFASNSYPSNHGYRDSLISTVSSNSTNMSSMVGSAISAIPGMNFLGRVFTSNESASVQSNAISAKLESKSYEPYKIARQELIKTFPGVLAILSDTWYYTSHSIQPKTPIGNPNTICGLILGLLGPMAKAQPQVLLHSAALVWQTRGIPMVLKKSTDQPTFEYTKHQDEMSKLILKVLSFAEMVNATLDLLKDNTTKTSSLTSSTSTLTTVKSVDHKVTTSPVEVYLLELLHCTMNSIPLSDLRATWASLNVLFNETNPASMSPRAVFLMFTILSDFVKLCGSQTVIEDRSISRGCQDACQRITEALNLIVGWQLESTTWLKRTLVVKQDNSNQKLSDISPTLEYKSTTASENNSIKGSTTSLATQSNNRLTSGNDSSSQLTGSVTQLSTMTSESKKSSSSLIRSSVKDTNNNRKDPSNSTQALFLLAVNLAELIDSICKSEDKDKLLPTLQAVWNNTLPYLKAKSARNVRFFLASSTFLASMSTFNYMRGVWKKASMDLLLDVNFFKMDIQALKQWLIVIDNLMTNDKTSFKELLARIPSGNTTAISNFMTSKEQEYEIRAQSLKRLAFVVLSSQVDQYCSNLPDIQERLTDNLRQAGVPIVHSHVFLCYRVLLLRMRPGNFATIWPSMVTELVQVLSQLETHLFQSTIDELRSPKDEQLLHLFLSASKFLETLCTLPAGYIPQYQIFNWAFVSPITPDPQHDSFVAYATRLDELLTKKFGNLTETDRQRRSASLCSMQNLIGVQDLHPFFHALAHQHKTRSGGLSTTFQEPEWRDACYLTGSLSLNAALQRSEHALYGDFADALQL